MQTLKEKIGLIRAAISDLKQITCDYKGHHRVCCPHILGTMRGQLASRVWQFSGGSSSPDDLPMWRNLYVDDVTNVALRDGEWHRGWMTGRRPHLGFDSIDAVVAEAHAAEIRQTSTPRIPGLWTPRQDRKK